MSDGPLPETWICGILATANAAQYARDWFRERRYQAAMAKKDEVLAAAQELHRTDLMQMMPALTRVLDWTKK